MVGDTLVETTGLVGESRLRVLGLDGQVRRSVDLPVGVFGEGVTVSDSTVWVLTWTDRRILRYTWPDLDPLPALPLDGEGWGACHDGVALWTSDGSATLTARDPATGVALRTITVRDADGRRVSRLNELDCAPDAAIWANVWQSDRLVRIEPGTGLVKGELDLSALRAQASAGARMGSDGTTNGVASTPGGELWLTGKGWPEMFLVDPDRPG